MRATNQVIHRDDGDKLTDFDPIGDWFVRQQVSITIVYIDDIGRAEFLIITEMFARSVLVTGCNRGLGFGFVKKLAPHVEILIATCRDPENAKVFKIKKKRLFSIKPRFIQDPCLAILQLQELQQLAIKHDNIIILTLGNDYIFRQSISEDDNVFSL